MGVFRLQEKSCGSLRRLRNLAVDLGVDADVVQRPGDDRNDRRTRLRAVVLRAGEVAALGGRSRAHPANVAVHCGPRLAASTGHAAATSPARLRSSAARVASSRPVSNLGGGSAPATSAATRAAWSSARLT